MGNSRSVPTIDLSVGLKTRQRETMLPIGAAQDGSRNVWHNPLVAKTPPGHKRLVNELKNDHGYLLSGNFQYFRGEITAVGSLWALAGPYTLEWVFRIDGPSRVWSNVGANFATNATIMAKGLTLDGTSEKPNTTLDAQISLGTATLDFATFISAPPRGGASGDGPAFEFIASGATGAAADAMFIDSTSIPGFKIEYGTTYHAAITRDAVTLTLYLAPAGGNFATGNKTIAVSFPLFTAEADHALDIFLGAVGLPATSTINVRDGFEHVSFPFPGTIYEVRKWSTARSLAELNTYKLRQLTAAEIAAEPTLKVYYRLTGAGTAAYYFTPTVGAVGFAANQTPYLYLMPRKGTWVNPTHPLSALPLGPASALAFDGRGQFLQVPQAYRYRSLVVDQDGALGWDDIFAVGMRTSQISFKANATLWHFTDVPQVNDTLTDVRHFTATATLNATFPQPLAGPKEHFQGYLETVLDGGALSQYRAVFCYGEKVLAEAITVAAGDLNDTLLRLSVKAGTVIVTFTTAAGANTVVAQDNGAGGFVKLSGAGALDAFGATNTINYATGVMVLGHAAAIDAGSGVADYQSLRIASCTSTGGGNVAINPNESVVTVALDLGNKLLRLKVNGTSFSTTLSAGTTVPIAPFATTDEPTGSARKYLMHFGTGVYGSRKMNWDNVDTQAVAYFTNYDRCFKGTIRNAFIANPTTLDKLNAFHEQLLYLTDALTRDDITRPGINVQSCWPMDEGIGPSLVDIAALGNDIPLLEDPGHRWSNVDITTVARIGASGVFDHRYRDAAGEVRKRLAVYSGSFYDVDPTSGALTYLRDGFRNDDNNIISVERFQDTTIVAADGSNGKPAAVWQDQVYSLSIDPPTGPIPVALTHQGDPKAAKKKGVRRYAFTFYSRHQNKRSALGPIIEVDIKFKKANVIFGTAAEINQDYPRSPYSAKKAPYDFFTAAPNSQKLGFSSWYGNLAVNASTDPSYFETRPGTTGLNTNAAPLKRLNLTNWPEFKDNGTVEIKDIVAAVDLQNNRVFVEDAGDDRLRFVGAFPGSKGFLWLDDTASFAATTTAGGLIDIPGCAAGTSYLGTGLFNHGSALPKSYDPQVTHLEIWCTLANGNEFHLVNRVLNGTTDFIDSIPDELMVGEVLDVDKGSPPSARFVHQFAGRYFYFGNSLSPQRLYYSQIGEPHNVPPENTIDLLDGSSLAITGVKSNENVMMLTKSDTMFLVVPTGNPNFPFRIETRYRRNGCWSPFGIATDNDTFFFPDERGISTFDTAALAPITDDIVPTYQRIDPANSNKIVCFESDEHDAIVWCCPSGNTHIGEEVVNDFALVFFTQQGAWALLDGFHVAYAARIPDDDEVDEIWLICPQGYIYTWDSGIPNYGVGATTNVNPALAGSPGTFSTTQLTLTQATLANLPEGYKGFAITVVKASTGERETRLCTADNLAAPSVITLNQALSFTPANTSDFSVIIGSIESDLILGEVSYAGVDKMSNMTDVHMQLTPQDAVYPANFEVLWRASKGIDETAVVEGSYSISNQRGDYLLGVADKTGSHAGLRCRLRIRCRGANTPFEVRNMTPRYSPDAPSGNYQNDN